MNQIACNVCEFGTYEWNVLAEEGDKNKRPQLESVSIQWIYSTMEVMRQDSMPKVKVSVIFTYYA